MEHTPSFAISDGDELQMPSYKFRFIDIQSLSDSEQLIVAKSRAPAGYKQSWAKFELMDKTTFHFAFLHWKTKYAPPKLPPNTKRGSKLSTVNVPDFFLDLVYQSKDTKYRFAIRITRAKIGVLTDEREVEHLLLHLIKAQPWDPPQGGGYTARPEQPDNWLELPVTVKAFARNKGEFDLLRHEVEVLCGSQNAITWCNSLPGVAQTANPVLSIPSHLPKRSAALDKLAAKVHPTLQEDALAPVEPDHPFIFDPPLPSELEVRNKTNSTVMSVKDVTNEYWKAYGVPSDQMTNPFTFESSTPPHLGRIIHAEAENGTSNRQMPSDFLPSFVKLHTLSLNNFPDSQKRKPGLTPPQSPLQDKRIRLEEQSSLNYAQITDILRQIDSKENPKYSSFGLTSEPMQIYAKPEPEYRFTGNGREINAEYGRDLTLSEIAVLQWAEEYDKRYGRFREGLVDLSRVVNLEEDTKVEDLTMDIVSSPLKTRKESHMHLFAFTNPSQTDSESVSMDLSSGGSDGTYIKDSS